MRKHRPENEYERREEPNKVIVISTFMGRGKKLSDAKPLQVGQSIESAPTDDMARRVAGTAALARIEQQQSLKVHTYQAAASETAAAVERSQVPVEDFALLSLYSTCPLTFSCPLTGETLTKSDREIRLKEAILKRFEQDAVEASIMMIHTFNNHRDKVKAAVDIINKYVENVSKHPIEEKYRTIKVRNKVFQEKVHCVEGCREFLQALGFQSTMIPLEGQEEDEEFLVLPEQTDDALELMVERMDRLRRGEPVKAQLDRRPQAFRPSPNAARFELPPELYNLTTKELKREQQERSELVDKITMLPTKAMREKQIQRELRKYNYTVLRIRLPDGNLLQGTFYAWDRMPMLFNFVRESLVDGWQPFELIASGAHKLQESEEVAFAQCNLVPAALLTFSWDPAVQPDTDTAVAAGVKSPALLKPDLLNSIRTLR